MEDGYEKLFAAIYKLAVHDDYVSVCGRIQNALIRKGIPKSYAIDYINENRAHIKDRIQRNVYMEYQQWGGETRAIQVNSINALIEEVVNSYKREGIT